MNKITNIALIGFGVVGEGVYRVITNTPGLQMQIKKIGIKNSQKPRNAPMELFTNCITDILNDPEIETIVELIDDAEKAFEIVKLALLKGKHVVSANKKMLAWHLPELIELQKENDVSLLYEAAVGGSIPILRNLEEYYNNDLLQSICGIINGSTNFILTRMTEFGDSYELALKEAQDAGFAESNPDLDVLGLDAQNKLVILLKHTFGISVEPHNIYTRGITSISLDDIHYAHEKKLSIKLIARAFFSEQQEVVAYIMPHFVPNDHQFSKVRNEYNVISIGSLLADEQLLYGKGAGRYPTSSAVLSDLSALNYNYRYEYKKSRADQLFEIDDNYPVDIYMSCPLHTSIDLEIFDELKEQHFMAGKKYFTGTVNLKKLKSSTALLQEGVSIIGLNVQGENRPVLSSLYGAQKLHPDFVA